MASDYTDEFEWELQSAAMMEADKIYPVPSSCINGRQTCISQPESVATSTDGSSTADSDSGAATRAGVVGIHSNMGCYVAMYSTLQHHAATALLAAHDPILALPVDTPALSAGTESKALLKACSIDSCCSIADLAGPLTPADVATAAAQQGFPRKAAVCGAASRTISICSKATAGQREETPAVNGPVVAV